MWPLPYAGRLTRTFFFPMITIMLYERAISRGRSPAFHFIAEGAEGRIKNTEYRRKEGGRERGREEGGRDLKREHCRW